MRATPGLPVLLAHWSGARAGIFLQGFAKGGDGLVEPRRPALPLAERSERIAEIVLGGPFERRARVHSCKASRKAATASSSRAVPLPLAERPERIAEIVRRPR
jgi:hypothetical protein